MRLGEEGFLRCSLQLSCPIACKILEIHGRLTLYDVKSNNELKAISAEILNTIAFNRNIAQIPVSEINQMKFKEKNSVQDESEKTRQSRIFVVIAAILLIGSTTLNVLLSQKIRYLTEELSIVESQGRLKEGEIVPSLEAKDLSGNLTVISYSETSQPTFLYIFTPQCHWCSENLNNIKLLASETRGRYRLLGLSLDRNQPETYSKITI